MDEESHISWEEGRKIPKERRSKRTGREFTSFFWTWMVLRLDPYCSKREWIRKPSARAVYLIYSSRYEEVNNSERVHRGGE